MSWIVEIAARTPSEGSPPTLVSVGPVAGPFGLSVTDAISTAQKATVSFLPEIQTPNVRQWIGNPAAEVWITRNNERIFAGPILARSAQPRGDGGTSISLQCQGLWAYLYRLLIDPDAGRVFTQEEQIGIARDLINEAQAKDYGNYGLDTSGMVDDAVLRNRTYEAGKIHKVAQRVEELAAVQNGFEFSVDPATRVVTTGSPTIGLDLSASVNLDRASIASSGASWSQGPEDIVTDAYAISNTNTPEGLVVGHAIDDPLREAYGRSEMGAAYQGVTDQTTINEHAADLAGQRSAPLFVPSAKVWGLGLDLDNLAPGNLVAFAYDYGLGLESGTVRIEERTLAIDEKGEESAVVKLDPLAPMIPEVT